MHRVRRSSTCVRCTMQMLPRQWLIGDQARCHLSRPKAIAIAIRGSSRPSVKSPPLFCRTTPTKKRPNYRAIAGELLSSSNFYGWRQLDKRLPHSLPQSSPCSSFLSQNSYYKYVSAFGPTEEVPSVKFECLIRGVDVVSNLECIERPHNSWARRWRGGGGRTRLNPDRRQETINFGTLGAPCSYEARIILPWVLIRWADCVDSR